MDVIEELDVSALANTLEDSAIVLAGPDSCKAKRGADSSAKCSTTLTLKYYKLPDLELMTKVAYTFYNLRACIQLMDRADHNLQTNSTTQWSMAVKCCTHKVSILRSKIVFRPHALRFRGKF